METTAIFQVVCASCGAKNRVPQSRAKDKPVCGTCKTVLYGEHPAALDEQSFARYIEHNELPVLVDFWAAWCGPCRAMAPAFEQAARELAGQALLAKLDTDASAALSSRFRIESIPTLVLFKGGHEIARQTGALSTSSQIAAWFAEASN